MKARYPSLFTWGGIIKIMNIYGKDSIHNSDVA